MSRKVSYRGDDTDSDDRDYLCRGGKEPRHQQMNFEFANEDEVNLLMSVTENLRDTIDSLDRKFLMEEEY